MSTKDDKDQKDKDLEEEEEESEEAADESEEGQDEDEGAGDTEDSDNDGDEDEEADDDESKPEGIDFEKELEALEATEDESEEDDDDSEDSEEEGAADKKKEKVKKKAIFSFNSQKKRLKELGIDPDTLEDAAEDETEEAPSGRKKSKFVTRDDLALIEAERRVSSLAKTEAEKKVIMWYVRVKGLSVEDAHLLANKGKVKKLSDEIRRKEQVHKPRGGTGAGGKGAEETKIPKLPANELRALLASGMKWDPKQKAYVGQKVRHRYIGKGKWVTERVTK